MKEQKILDIINETLSQKSHIGDDCAYLKELGIVVTQDSLVEGIHFLLKNTTPYGLGFTALSVNLSDILASGAKPAYVTISLSLPKNIDVNFVKGFYQACEDLSNIFDFEVIGGDITGSDKVFISVCAIGKTDDRQISSRSTAKVGDAIVLVGAHGDRSAGLFALENEISGYLKLKEAHLTPKLVDQAKFSKCISTVSVGSYTMMDTSDGLADALVKIGQASGKTLCVDFEKINCSVELVDFCNKYNKNLSEFVLYGGEDYGLIACVDKSTLSEVEANYTIIGEVKNFDGKSFAKVKIEDEIQPLILEETYNHFETKE